MQSNNPDPIYLDGFATMPLAPEALAAMVAAWGAGGNAGSGHVAGERAARCVAGGRSAVATLIGAAPNEIVFTSGATEANNLAIFGVAAMAPPERRRIIVSAIEHKSVLAPAKALARQGFSINLAPVDSHGCIDLDAFDRLIDEDVVLVSVMAANNETGVIQPIAEISARAHAVGALMHCDAAQAVSKIPVDVIEWDVDYLSLSAHKCYGPMGIGALYVAAGSSALQPLLYGGGQQRSLRPGTEPVPLIAGFGAAADAARENLARDRANGDAMAMRLADGLAARQVRFMPISGEHKVLPGSLALRLPGVDAESLCVAVGQSLCLSTGSACTHGQLRQSHVLESMNFSGEEAAEVVRIFCPRGITGEQIDAAVATIADAISRIQ